MPTPQDPGTGGRSPLFGLPAVSISCPRCSRLVSVDAVSCPRCAQRLTASGGSQQLQAPPLRAAAPQPPPAPPPAARPAPSDRTVVLDPGPGITAELPDVPGGRPVDVTTPPGIPVLPDGDAGAGAGAPASQGLGGPPLPPGRRASGGDGAGAGQGSGRVGLALPRLRRGTGWRDSPALLAGVVLVVTAVLWFVVATFINHSGSSSAVSPVARAGAALRPVQPGTIAATATSVQKAEGGVTYEPENTLDNRPTTAWNSRGNGVGATITYTFTGPVHVRGISVRNGYQKLNDRGQDLWRLNERLREVRVETEAGKAVWTLKDVKQSQTFERDLGTTRWVRLVVVSTYPSQKWRDVGLSEISFVASD